MNSPICHFEVSLLTWNNLVLLISDSHSPSANLRLTQGYTDHQSVTPTHQPQKLPLTFTCIWSSYLSLTSNKNVGVRSPPDTRVYCPCFSLVRHCRCPRRSQTDLNLHQHLHVPPPLSLRFTPCVSICHSPSSHT